MKARKVTITLKVLTALPIGTLKCRDWWKEGMITHLEDPDLNVVQVQVNVIKKGK